MTSTCGIVLAMSFDPDSAGTAAAQAFVHSAHALETWDLVELREAWSLPEDTPLDRLADLVARIHHLPVKTPESLASALRASAARPWIERSCPVEVLAARLPAVVALAAIRDRSGQRM